MHYTDFTHYTHYIQHRHYIHYIHYTHYMQYIHYINYMHYIHYTQCPNILPSVDTNQSHTHTLSARTPPTFVLFSTKPERAVSNTSRLIIFMPRGLIRWHHVAAS